MSKQWRIQIEELGSSMASTSPQFINSSIQTTRYNGVVSISDSGLLYQTIMACC